MTVIAKHAWHLPSLAPEGPAVLPGAAARCISQRRSRKVRRRLLFSRRVRPQRRGMALADRTGMVDSGHSRALSLIVAADDGLRRARLRALLRRLDGHIREASDCWDLMSRLLATGDPVDLVVSDLGHLPANGVAALASARAAGIEVPFLLLTPAGGPAIRSIAAELNAAVLDEPVAASRLVARVHQMSRRLMRPAIPDPDAS